MRFLFLVPAMVVGVFPFAHGAQVFTSGPAQSHLLELYTSEGCSSCPPAEAWLSERAKDPALWHGFVPVAFHVDYWDNLGWPDRFASATFTDRQREYATAWGGDSVYTPCFILDGREWRPGAPPEAAGAGGLLRVATIDASLLEISYQSPTDSPGPWDAHATILRMNEKSDIRAGENTGRKLAHDFVVTEIVSAPLGSNNHATLHLPSAKGGALAVWVTRRDDLIPRQATGGFLE